MGNKMNLRQNRMSYLVSVVIGAIILSGCASTGKIQGEAEMSAVPVVKSVDIDPSPERTVVTIANSEVAPYTSFQLVDPPRIIVDIRGSRGDGLPERIDVGEGQVETVEIEKGEAQALTTRVILGLTEVADYRAESDNNFIRLTLISKTSPSGTEKAGAEERATAASSSEEVGGSPVAPRIFVKPQKAELNQVLGIDFVMLERGKSGIVVTTDKKIPYDLDRKDPKALVLKLSDATIPPQLLRQVDSSHFQSAVETIRPTYSAKENKVSIGIVLREIVPFHVKQSDGEIHIDFERSSISAVEKKIVPLQLAQASSQTDVPIKTPGNPPGGSAAPEPSALPGFLKTKYTGAPMTMDFVNADVTNVLRLIGEVSNLNLVWGPDVKGTVSMRLKNVPWDQALDLILTNNNLAKRKAGNVIWVTTMSQMSQIETEEKKKRDELEAELDAKVKKIREERERKKELEPIVTEYIGVDFASAEEIKKHIEGIKSDRGTIGVDARTNTIIIKDIASTIEEAKKLAKQFDTPVKQVMIEARIVDATTNFTRDLGIKWDKFQIQRRNSTGVPFSEFGGTPATVTPGDPSTYSNGGNLYSPTFTTPTPGNWDPNLGLAFAKLSDSGLTATILDAKLALSELEGTSKTISAPKVIATNGEEAVISRGDSIIIPATENVESKTLDATLSLTVTPTVSYNDYISLDVEVTDDTAGVNVIFKKAVQTKLMIKSGETVVIGGIYTEDRGDDETGIPGLRRVPFLGWLFKAQHKRLKKTELLIFLTPTVIPSST